MINLTIIKRYSIAVEVAYDSIFNACQLEEMSCGDYSLHNQQVIKNFHDQNKTPTNQWLLRNNRTGEKINYIKQMMYYHADIETCLSYVSRQVKKTLFSAEINFVIANRQALRNPELSAHVDLLYCGLFRWMWEQDHEKLNLFKHRLFSLMVKIKTHNMSVGEAEDRVSWFIAKTLHTHFIKL